MTVIGKKSNAHDSKSLFASRTDSKINNDFSWLVILGLYAVSAIFQPLNRGQIVPTITN